MVVVVTSQIRRLQSAIASSVPLSSFLHHYFVLHFFLCSIFPLFSFLFHFQFSLVPVKFSAAEHLFALVLHVAAVVEVVPGGGNVSFLSASNCPPLSFACSLARQ